MWNLRENTCVRVSTTLRPTILLKKRLRHRYFSVSFAEFLRAPFFKENLLVIVFGFILKSRIMLETWNLVFKLKNSYVVSKDIYSPQIFWCYQFSRKSSFLEKWFSSSKWWQASSVLRCLAFSFIKKFTQHEL